jgi:gliding motility-associated-like protein
MTEDITQLSNGLYQVTITDSNNCAIEETFFIEEAPVLTFDTIINPADCSLNNGSIFLVDFEGENPYLYSWSSGETTDSITNKSTGNYSVTITDNIGCIQVYELVIPNTQSATLNSTVENVTCENGSDGSIDINIINGNPPYIYTWNTGDSANFIDNLPSGFYAVTVTDDINCIYTASFNLVVTSLIDADTTIIDESCIGVQDGAIEYNILNGFSPFQYTWSNGESESSIDNLSPGSYLLDVVDSLGCIYQNEFNILPGNTIILLDSVTHNICSGENNGSIEVVVSGQGPYTFLWDNNSTDSLINNLTSGLYSLTVTDIDGCFKIKEFQIDDPDPITNNIEIIQPGCDENILGTATAIPSGGSGDFNFLWSNGQNTNTAVELVPGSYTVTISDDYNCSFIDSIIVEEIIPLLIGASVDSIDCYGDFASVEINTITGVSPFKYLWNNGSNEQIRNDLLAGIHAVTVTDAYGCSEELSFNLGQPDILSNSVVESLSPTSNGKDGLIKVDVFGGTTPYSVEWSNGLTDVLTIDNLDYGIYTYTITDSNGCITFGEVVFTPEPLIYTLDLINNLCFGQCIGSIGLEISGGATPYSFLWSSGSQDNLLEQLCNGIYSVTVEDNLGSSIIIDELIIDSPPILNSLIVVSDETCIDLNDGTISLNAFGGEPPYNYFLNGLTVNSTVTDLEPGNYVYLVVDNFGCEYTNTINIDSVDSLTLDVSQQNINCDNPNGQIEIVSNNINGYEILLNGDSYGSDNTISINNLSAADYTIQYVINDECIEDVENITILDEGLFEINFNPEIIKINFGEDFNLNMTISDPNGIIQSIDWDSNSNVQCDQFNEDNYCLILSGTAIQNDLLTLITTLNNGCVYKYFIPIEVEIETDLIIPNIFSPNGDGTNDVFTIKTNPSLLEINSFSIYDRWGNRIFDQDNVNPMTFMGWDGRFNNNYVQPGVYVYSILLTFIDGQTKQLYGDLTIVK